MLISLAILVLAVAFLTVTTLMLSNCLAKTQVQIHDFQEKASEIDLDSGMEKVLSTLEAISASADKYVKEQLNGVIRQLANNVNTYTQFP